MFFVDEEKVDVIRLFNDTKFKPKYDTDTGEIYKFQSDSHNIEFIKNKEKNIWRMYYLGNNDESNILELFIMFKCLDGIIEQGFAYDDGRREILKQEILKLNKPKEFYLKNKEEKQ